MAWGYHLAINLKKCAQHGAIFKGKSQMKIAHPIMQTFVDDQVKEIDMTKYGPMILEHFGTNVENSQKDLTKDDSKNISGYTMYQMIETSNISGHFVDNTQDIYLDVFSCKEFDEKSTVDWLNNYFKPEEHNYEYLVRGFEQKDKKEYK